MSFGNATCAKKKAKNKRDGISQQLARFTVDMY